MSKDLRYTVGDALRGLRLQKLDANGVAQDINAWTAVLKGRADDIGKSISIAGITDTPAQGWIMFPAPGSQITLSDLGARREAIFTCQVTWNNGTYNTMSDEFAVTLRRPVA